MKRGMAERTVADIALQANNDRSELLRTARQSSSSTGRGTLVAGTGRSTRLYIV